MTDNIQDAVEKLKKLESSLYTLGGDKLNECKMLTLAQIITYLSTVDTEQEPKLGIILKLFKKGR